MQVKSLFIASLTALALGLIVSSSFVSTNAQTAVGSQVNPTSTRTLSNGQKATIKGILVENQGDQTFTVREESGASTQVVLAPNASIKTKGGFLKSGNTFSPASLTRGLYLEVEGKADDQGRLVAQKVRFSKSELRVAQALEARVDPVENRVGDAETRVSAVEENARRTSGQIDELLAVSNAARGGAKAAQETADMAVNGVQMTNERIGEIDNYVMDSSVTINFRNGSAVLSPEAKTQLDSIAMKAQTAKGYVLEVTGYTDSTGKVEKNRMLSQRRADAAIRYLLDNHEIPLRRIVPGYGYGETETKAVADNSSRDGRAQNRRVEVKILVSKGIIQEAPEMKPVTKVEDSLQSSPPQ